MFNMRAQVSCLFTALVLTVFSCRSMSATSQTPGGLAGSDSSNDDDFEGVIDAHPRWFVYPNDVEVNTRSEVVSEDFSGNTYQTKSLLVSVSGTFPEHIEEGHVFYHYTVIAPNTILIAILGAKDQPAAQRMVTGFKTNEFKIELQQKKLVSGQTTAFDVFKVYVTLAPTSGEPMNYKKKTLGSF